MVILTSFPPPVDGVRHRQENTKAHVQGRMLGNGVLFVAESRLSWMAGNGEGFSLEYPAITLHAVSRDTSSFPHECIYMMVDADLGKGDQQNGNTESSSEDEDSSKISEIRFIPEDKGALEQIYRALSDCQVLHPDENDSFSDDGGEAEDEEGFYEAEEGGQLTPQGEEMLTRMEAMLAAGDDGIVQDQPAIGAQANGDAGVTVPASTDAMETEQFDDAD